MAEICRTGTGKIWEELEPMTEVRFGPEIFSPVSGLFRSFGLDFQSLLATIGPDWLQPVARVQAP